MQTLLARVQEKSNNLEASIATLGEAKQLRGRILKRVQVLHHRSNFIQKIVVQVEQPDAVLEQRQLAARVCHQVHTAVN